jgi:hypothetical protein
VLQKREKYIFVVNPVTFMQISSKFYVIEVGKGRANKVIIEGETVRASAGKEIIFGGKMNLVHLWGWKLAFSVKCYREGFLKQKVACQSTCDMMPCCWVNMTGQGILPDVCRPTPSDTVSSQKSAILSMIVCSALHAAF